MNGQRFGARLSDGLPLAPVDAARVQTMLGDVPARRAIAQLPPLNQIVIAQDLAYCAVVSGCAPEHFPFLLAALDAVAAPEFNLLGVLTTTGSVAVGVILHGPEAELAGANSGGNCLGPGTATNAAVGRGVALAVRVLSGAEPGLLDMATLGQPAKYGMCLAEASTPAPWPPFHAMRGLDAGASGVTAVAAAGMVEVADVYSDSVEGMLSVVASALPLPAALSADGSVLGGGEQLVVIPPEWAARLSAESWTKDDVQSLLFRRSQMPLDRLPEPLRTHVSPAVEQRGFIGSALSPADIELVVAGGPGTKAMYLPSWPGGSRMVTRGLVA